MAKTENSRSGINELYPPVGHAEAAALVAAAASSAAFCQDRIFRILIFQKMALVLTSPRITVS